MGIVVPIAKAIFYTKATKTQRHENREGME